MPFGCKPASQNLTHTILGKRNALVKRHKAEIRGLRLALLMTPLTLQIRWQRHMPNYDRFKDP
jgi:hypothetical protein